jgi:hypothetical protein
MRNHVRAEFNKVTYCPRHHPISKTCGVVLRNFYTDGTSIAVITHSSKVPL